MKALPRGVIDSAMLAWLPWEEDRSLPFSMEGASGRAWVKTLSFDAQTGAESLLYRLEPGWSIDRMESTVPEDLIVWQGELQVGDHALRKYSYSYRPAGYTVGPCSAPLGATIISFCGGPDEPRFSKVPVPALDTEALPWRSVTGLAETARFYWKPLRGDEETLDTFRLLRAVAGTVTPSVESHEGYGSMEEGFFLEADQFGWCEAWPGRLARVELKRGYYVCHGADWAHGKNQMTADMLAFKHDGYAYSDHADPMREELFEMFPEETPAVQALREGRDPGLPRRFGVTGQ